MSSQDGSASSQESHRALQARIEDLEQRVQASEAESGRLRELLAQHTTSTAQEGQAPVEHALRDEVAVCWSERQWLHTVLDTMPMPVLLLEPHSGTTTFANRVAQAFEEGRLLLALQDSGADGLSRADGSSFASQNSPAARIANGESIDRLELQWNTANGGKTLLLSAATVPAMNGHPPTVIVVWQEVTEQKETARKLHTSRERLARFVADLPGMAYRRRADAAQTLEFASGGSLTVTGYPAEHFYAGAVNYANLLQDGEQERVRQTLAAASGEQPYEMQYEIASPGGPARWIWDTGRRVDTLPDGTAVVEGFVIDVTARKQAEADMSAWRERYELAMQASGQLLYDWDTESDHVTWGGEHERLLGYTADEMPSTLDRWSACIHEEDAARLQGEIQQKLRDNQPLHCEYRVRRKDGSYLVMRDEGLYASRAEQRKHVVGFLVDVSERRRLEADLHARNEELARSNEDLQQFAYVASHDLREPLRSMSQYAQLLERNHRERLNEQEREFLSHIVQGTHRMDRLITDLLSYARLRKDETWRVEPTDLKTVVQWALMNLSVALRETEAQVTYDNLPTVAVQQTQMVRLFQNLLSNALQYRSPAPPRIEITAQERNGEWLLCVRDNGMGFEPQYAERIFGLFKRLHGREYPGSGIGLAVCRRIIEAHGGRIWAESQPGQGATFWFTLPMEQPST